MRDLSDLLFAITENLESEIFGQYIGQATKFHRKQGKDPADTAKALLTKLRGEWSTLEGRLRLCPGKDVLKLLRERVQQDYGVSLTNARIVGAINRSDIPPDLWTLLTDIDSFRTQKSGVGSDRKSDS